MPTPIPSKEKVERIIKHYISKRGPERTWTAMVKECGFICGKSLRKYVDTFAPFYGIYVPPRICEGMTQLERARVEMDVAGAKPGPFTEPHAAIADTAPGLDAYAEDAAATEVEKHKHPAAPYGYSRGEIPVYYSRADNTFAFGATSDNHIGSKYHRADVLADLYRRFREAELDCVFNAGNWIDGYHQRVNHFDLIPGAHTMEDQLRLLVADYPRFAGRKCIEINEARVGGTFAVTGDDHEGWWARAHGFPIGDRAQDQMRKAGREDWHDLGYMEAHIRLVNVNTGASTLLSVVHPGGGTSYAISYHPQKRVEALEGGEKPAVDLSGHLHKLFFFNIRNVWCIGTGCTQDITPFIRNRVRQEVHVGGQLVHLEQDPKTGAIVGCGVKTLRYFIKGYYNNRWSKDAAVSLPPRSV